MSVLDENAVFSLAAASWKVNKLNQLRRWLAEQPTVILPIYRTEISLPADHWAILVRDKGARYVLVAQEYRNQFASLPITADDASFHSLSVGQNVPQGSDSRQWVDISNALDLDEELVACAKRAQSTNLISQDSLESILEFCKPKDGEKLNNFVNTL